MAIVSKRYAQALFDIAQDKYKQDLEDLSSLYMTNEDFKNTLNSPKISQEEKIKIIKTLFNDDTFLNFVALVLKDGRFCLIDDISKKYNELNNNLKKKVNIEIVSAKAISKDMAKKIAQKYKKIEKANEVSFTVKIDESLLGGIKVIVNDKIYDSSVKTKLEKML